MKALAGLIVACALLTGCTTTGGGSGNADLDTLIANIQKYTAEACQFLPTVASVTEVIGALSGAPGIGVTVGQVGGAICAGIVTTTPAAVRRGGTIIRRVNTPRGVIKVRGTRV